MYETGNPVAMLAAHYQEPDTMRACDLENRRCRQSLYTEQLGILELSQRGIGAPDLIDKLIKLASRNVCHGFEQIIAVRSVGAW